MQEIINLINEVSPDDTDKLNEINLRVYGYLHGYLLDFKYFPGGTSEVTYFDKEKNQKCNILFSQNCLPKYTSNRDMLKYIRPKGYLFSITNIGGWDCTMGKMDNVVNRIRSFGKTEELAELSTILKIIDRERKKNENPAKA